MDLVFCGHNHFYERTFPLRGGKNIASAQEPDFTDPGGTVFVVTGGGGGALRTAVPNANSAHYESTYHHIQVDVKDNAITLRAVNKDGALMDKMTLTKKHGTPPPVFHRGDTDGSGTLELTDAIRVLGFLFLGDEAPSCLEAADTDDSGALELTDAVLVLTYLFTGGLAPPPPGPPPGPCGPDPAGSPALSCAEYPGC